MDLGLRGKRALVSGSSSGIGAAIAFELAAEGCVVVVHGRDKARTETVAAEIRAAGGTAFSVLGDLTKEEEAAGVVEQALASVGAVDVLVNNSGGATRRGNYDWSEITAQQWQETFELNLLGTFRVSRGLVEAMKSQRWGRIINISTLASIEAFGQLTDYAAIKAALNKFTADMSKLLGPHEITVNTVIPGIIKTPAMQKTLKLTAEQNGWGDDPKERERRFVAMWSAASVPRLGEPQDIAAAVAFLASPRAGYINGATMRVDGGSAHFV